MNRNEHPAWNLYNLYRTARLNEFYYAARISHLQTINQVMDIVIAVAAPGGTISALAFWQTQVGSAAWKVLLPLAAVVGFIKPFLSLPDKIKKMEPCLSGYRMLFHDTGELINDMIQRRTFDSKIVEGFNEVYKRKGVLIGLNPETKPKKRLAIKCREDVDKEFEKYDFIIPEA